MTIDAPIRASADGATAAGYGPDASPGARSRAVPTRLPDGEAGQETAAMPTSPTLQTLDMRLLGAFRLTYEDAPLSQLPTPRVQALLAYLLLHQEAPQSRQQLAFLLWPDTTDAQARTNLRQLLHALKQALPQADHFVQTDAKTLHWQPDAPCRLDVAEFEETLTQAG